MGNNGDVKIFKEAFKPLKKSSKIIFYLMIFLSMIGVTLTTVNAKILGEISEKILNKVEIKSVIIIFSGMFLLNAILSFIKSQVQVRYIANIEYLYKEYTEKVLMSSTMKWIRAEKKGDILTKISTNLTHASCYLSVGLPSIISRIISIIVSITVISLIEYKIILFLVPMIFVAFMLQMLAGKPLQSKRKALFDAIGESQEIANDGLTNYCQVKVNGIEDWFINRYDKSLNNVKNTYLKIFPQIVSFMSLGFIVSITPLIFLLFYGANLCSNGELLLKDYVTIVTLGIPITTLMTGLSQDVAGMQSTKAALTRLISIWNAPNEYSEFQDSKTYNFSSEMDSKIEMKNIEFAYDEENKILDNFSLSFEKNKKYIIKGGNGSGKSTLINLISGLYRPQSGIVSFDFENKKLDLNRIRERVAVVEQDSYLFKESVIGNIFIGYKNISENDKEKWYEESYVRDIIDKLPQGKNTMISEGGINLSGGQKRCINIARGLCRDSEIIILDEPTANIDSYTAGIISKEIVRASKKYNKTIIIITHDEELLSIGEDVNKIKLEELVLEMGGCA